MIGVVSRPLAPSPAALSLAMGRLGAGAAASRYLDHVLEGLRGSLWPALAWRTSRLTADGFPVELSFTSGDPVVRLTAEVAGPEVDHEARLALALALLPSTSGPPGLKQVEARLRGLQAGQPLRWGAWFGGRFDASGPRGKIYAEVPRSGSPVADAWAAERLGRWPLLGPERPIPLRMIGWEPGSGRLELYLRPGALEELDLSRLLQVAGMGPRLPELLTLLRDAWGASVRHRLPGVNFGWSFSVPADGGPEDTPPIVSLIAFAKNTFGPDDVARRSILALAERQGWDLDGYEAVSEPLARRPAAVAHHGMVSFVLAPGRPPVFHVGLRPPAD